MIILKKHLLKIQKKEVTMQLNQVPLLRVRESFIKWKNTRQNLKLIKQRIESQDAILTPNEAMIPPEIFGQYQRLVVSALQTEFCRQILYSKKRHGDKTIYEIYAQLA